MESWNFRWNYEDEFQVKLTLIILQLFKQAWTKLKLSIKLSYDWSRTLENFVSMKRVKENVRHNISKIPLESMWWITPGNSSLKTYFYFKEKRKEEKEIGEERYF